MDGNEWNMDEKINEQVKNKKQDNLITADSEGHSDHRIFRDGQLRGPAG